MFAIKKILNWKNRLALYLLIIFLFNLLFLNFPLVNVFGYEFAVLNSVLLIIASGLYIISSCIRKEDELKNIGKDLVLPALLFLVIPLFVSVINSFFTGFCSFSDGLLFYLVITLPSVIIGYSIGITSFFIFKRFRRLLFFLITAIILLIALAEFYFNPQVYFYNPVIGYLPGTIYDEALAVDFKLVVYRFLNLLFFGGLLYGIILHYSGKIRLQKSYIISYLVILPIIFLLLSPSFGYSTTFSSLESELSNKVTTDHFEIYFAKGIGDNLVKLITLHHEYYYKELVDYLKVTPKEKIRSFIFNDRYQKKELFGSANADIAKTWLYCVFITYDNYDESLKHEIAHIFSTEFGSGPFDVADMINPFLIEGVATASSPFFNNNDIDYLASVAYKGGYKVSLEKMYKFSSFFTQTSTISYIYAGSFTKYLIANYGIEKFKKLYTDLDFLKIYDKPLSEIEKSYDSYLESLNTESTKDKANYYFGRKSIFYKVCPRFIADRLGKAWGYYQDKDYEKASGLFNLILQKGENYSAVVGLSESLDKLDKRDSAIVLLKDYLIEFDNTAYFYNLELRLADLSAKNSNINFADSIYQKIIKQKPSITLYYLSELRTALSKKDSLLMNYVTAEDSGKYLILKNLNEDNYYYSSFPVIVDLSKSFNEDYNIFLKQFDKTFIVNDFLSAFGIYYLSQYMLENLDFNRARKMAALATRYKSENNLNLVFEDSFKRINWMYQNSNTLLERIFNIRE